MEAWQWILTAAGGVSAVGGAVAVINKWIRPIREHADWRKKMEEQNARDLRRFDELAEQLDENRKANQAVYKALIGIMNHMIDGNSIEHLKAARSELSRFIIEH